MGSQISVGVDLSCEDPIRNEVRNKNNFIFLKDIILLKFV
jgi:hypothetical protein